MKEIIPVYKCTAQRILEPNYFERMDYIRKYVNEGLSIFEHRFYRMDVVEGNEIIRQVTSIGRNADYYESARECIEDVFDPELVLGDAACAQAVKHASQWYDYGNLDELCEALTIITGKKWENGTIKSCCQSDWNQVVYPSEMEGDVDVIESIWFGMYDEYLPHDIASGDECIAMVFWNNGEDVTDLAKELGCKLENIKFLEEEEETK